MKKETENLNVGHQRLNKAMFKIYHTIQNLRYHNKI